MLILKNNFDLIRTKQSLGYGGYSYLYGLYLVMHYYKSRR